jgi:hypothetical protein
MASALPPSFCSARAPPSGFFAKLGRLEPLSIILFPLRQDNSRRLLDQVRIPLKAISHSGGNRSGVAAKRGWHFDSCHNSPSRANSCARHGETGPVIS